MKNTSKRILSTIISTVMMISSVQAAEGNISYPSGVTPEMTNSSYWESLLSNPNKVIMSKNEIKELNESNYASTSKTNLVDLESISEFPTSNNFEKYNRNLFINGNLIDEDSYIEKFTNGYEKMNLTYAVAVSRADIKTWPITDIVGYTADDPDDECELAYLLVNEPFIIGASCVVDGVKYYYGRSSCCGGWVCAKDLALFDSKSEWLKAWKVGLDDKDFIVINESSIQLEPMLLEQEISAKKLNLGTILKLVPESEIPSKLGEREGDYWYNYVVYLPTADSNGKYVAKPALIQKRYNVSVGYLPMTESNFLKLSFSKLGDRYGWGGMFDSEDSSTYSRAIYRCFGLDLPRNTTWQENMEDYVYDISDLTPDEKIQYIETLPVGSILYFPGYSMHYVGTKNNMVYTISACGVVSDPEGELDVRRHYTVMLIPASARRRNTLTWLESLDKVVNFSEKKAKTIETATVTVDYMDGDELLSSSAIMIGDLPVEPEIPEKEGYDFEGWYCDKDFKNIFDFSVPVIQNTVVYSKWVEKNTSSNSDGEKSSNVQIFSSGHSSSKAAVNYEVASDTSSEGYDDEESVSKERIVFSDVSKDSQFYDSICFVFEKNIMNGISKTKFDPESYLTRGMFVTMLYRMDGETSNNKYDNPFNDVYKEYYYFNPIIWAYGEEYVKGYNSNTFGPNDFITKYQLATVLFRYAEKNGIDVGNIEGTDVVLDDVPEYAKTPILWAYQNMLIEKSDEKFVTREQAADIFYRFLSFS
ncbi:MAG: S-layer homology domain-containing protein [Clostridia bacterium]|nr:S-layer homology domain-containing protein [Clostridia bacterium]